MRWVVELDSLIKSNPTIDFYPLSNESVILLTLDKDIQSGTTQMHCLSAFEWWYSAFGVICSTRALDAETGALQPGGTRMPAEKYLRLWREANTKSLSFGQMLDHGILLVATISKPTPFLDNPDTHKKHPELLQQRSSRYVVKANESEVVWRIPIKDVQALLTFNKISKVYVDSRKYPGNGTPESFTVEMLQAVDTDTSEDPGQSCLDQLDLFEVAA